MKRALLVAAVLIGLARESPAQIATETKFNEGKTMCWPIDFTDEDGDPVKPDAANYRITTWAGNTLKATTAISPLATSVLICEDPHTIPAGELNASNPNLPGKIVGIMGVEYTWAGTKQAADYMLFSLINVPGYPFP